jgi:hypothetical protein
MKFRKLELVIPVGHASQWLTQAVFEVDFAKGTN